MCLPRSSIAWDSPLWGHFLCHRAHDEDSVRAASVRLTQPLSAPATKPAAAVLTTRALRPSLDSCLYDWPSERRLAQCCPVSKVSGSSLTPSAAALPLAGRQSCCPSWLLGGGLRPSCCATCSLKAGLDAAATRARENRATACLLSITHALNSWVHFQSFTGPHCCLCLENRALCETDLSEMPCMLRKALQSKCAACLLASVLRLQQHGLAYDGLCVLQPLPARSAAGAYAGSTPAPAAAVQSAPHKRVLTDQHRQAAAAASRELLDWPASEQRPLSTCAGAGVRQLSELSCKQARPGAA